MASINIAGNTSGAITLSAPAVAGSNTATLPAATGELSMLGTSGQTWTVFTVGTTRISGTTYTNSTGKPITILLQFNQSSAATLTVNGATAIVFGGFAYVAPMTAIIPTGATYSFTAPSSIYAWAELR